MKILSKRVNLLVTYLAAIALILFLANCDRNDKNTPIESLLNGRDTLAEHLLKICRKKTNAYQFDSANYYARKLLTLSDSVSTNYLKGRIYEAYASSLKGNSTKFDTAFLLLGKAERIFETENNYKELGKIYNTYSYFYNTLFDPIKSNKSCLKSLKYYTLAKDTFHINLAKANVIKVYNNYGEYKKARELCLKEFADPLIKKDTVRLVRCEKLYAITFQEENRDEHIKLIKTALSHVNQNSIKQKEELKVDLYHIYSMLAEHYAMFAKNKGELNTDSARKYINLSDKINLDNYEDHCLLMSKLYYGMKKYDSCIYYNHLCRSIAEKKSKKILAVDYLSSIGNAYEKMKRFDSAFYYLNIYMLKVDSFQNDETKRKMLSSEINYKLEQQELINKSKLNQLDAKVKKFRYITVVIFLVLIIITISFFYIKHIEKKNRQAEFSLELINMQEEERKRISKDLHDVIGHRLLWLLLKSDDHKDYISEIINETREISRNLHPMQIEKLGLKRMLENLALEAEKNSGISFSYEIWEGIDTIDTFIQINCYRIIQESFSNIIKHSGAKDARLTVFKREKAIMITVIDNGKGFNVENAKKKRSFGLFSMEERAALLKTKIKINSTLNETELSFILNYVA